MFVALFVFKVIKNCRMIDDAKRHTEEVMVASGLPRYSSDWHNKANEVQYEYLIEKYDYHEPEFWAAVKKQRDMEMEFYIRRV